MHTTRIRELRLSLGLTQEQLAEASGLSNTLLSKLERGKVGVSMKHATKLSNALGKPAAYVLGLSDSEEADAGSIGLARDVVDYVPKAGDPFANLAGPNRYLKLSESNVLDRIGIHPGDVMVINDSQAALDKIKPLQAVQCAYHSPSEPNKAIEIIRQFVPPSLLITNCSTGNLPSLDLEQDDVNIVAVVETVHRQLGERH